MENVAVGVSVVRVAGVESAESRDVCFVCGSPRTRKSESQGSVQHRHHSRPVDLRQACMTHMERSETGNESFASDASDRLSRRVELAHGDLRERHRGCPSFWRATPSRALATNPDDDGFHPDQKRSLHGRQVSLVRARRCSGSTCPSEPCASSAEAAAIEGRRDRAHQRVQAVLPTLSRSSPASRSDRCADLFGSLFPRRAETVLERIPTFNLVLVAGSPAERDLLPRLIKSLFGVADIVSRRLQAILLTPTCRQDGSARDGQRGRAYERRDGRNDRAHHLSLSPSRLGWPSSRTWPARLSSPRRRGPTRGSPSSQLPRRRPHESTCMPTRRRPRTTAGPSMPSGSSSALRREPRSHRTTSSLEVSHESRLQSTVWDDIY